MSKPKSHKSSPEIDVHQIPNSRVAGAVASPASHPEHEEGEEYDDTLF
jgi:hypothetical protein